jgi:TetR/AcrR family transcriptional regulator
MAAPRRPRKTPARQPGRPSARTAQDVRGQLIAAARDLFLKYGYRAVSSRQVAAAAGANPAMIHYYFGNKHGLYKAMLEQAIGPGVARLNAMLEAPPEEASVARMLDTYMHILEANPWIPGLLLREVLMPDGAFRDQFIRDFGSRFAPRVAELVRHETLSGHLRKDLDPRLAVVSFLSLGLFPFIAMPVWTRALELRLSQPLVEQLIAHTLRIFREGVRA